MAIIDDNELLKDSVKVIKEHIAENSGYELCISEITQYLNHDFYSKMVDAMYEVQERKLRELAGSIIKEQDKKYNEALGIIEPIEEYLERLDDTYGN